MSNVVLEVKNVEKSFGDLQVLRDVSLTVHDGEVISIIGSSGSGKTTLLRCITHLETVDGGSIIVDGMPLVQTEEAAASDGSLTRKTVYADETGMLGEEPMDFEAPIDMEEPFDAEQLDETEFGDGGWE